MRTKSILVLAIVVARAGLSALTLIIGCDVPTGTRRSEPYTISDPYTAELERAQALNSEIVRLMRENRYDDALAKCDIGLSIFEYPMTKRIFRSAAFGTRLSKVKHLEEKGKFHEAIPVMRLVIENCYECSRIDFATYYRKLALLLLKVDRTEEAAEALRKAISYDPDNVVPYVLLSQELNKLDDTQEAFQVLQKAVKVDPDNAGVHYGLGSSYFGQRRFLQAIESLKKSIKLEPNDVLPHIMLCLAYKSLGMKDELKQSLQRAIAIDPNATTRLLERIPEMKNLLQEEKAKQKAQEQQAIQMAKDYIPPFDKNRAEDAIREIVQDATGVLIVRGWEAKKITRDNYLVTFSYADVHFDPNFTGQQEFCWEFEVWLDSGIVRLPALSRAGLGKNQSLKDIEKKLAEARFGKNRSIGDAAFKELTYFLSLDIPKKYLESLKENFLEIKQTICGRSGISEDEAKRTAYARNVLLHWLVDQIDRKKDLSTEDITTKARSLAAVFNKPTLSLDWDISKTRIIQQLGEPTSYKEFEENVGKLKAKDIEGARAYFDIWKDKWR